VLSGSGLHAPPGLLPPRPETGKHPCHRTGNGQDRRFRVGQRNPVGTTFHRLCVNKMVRTFAFSLFFSVYLPVCWSLCLSVCLFCLSARLSVSLFVCLFVYLCVFLSDNLSFCLSDCQHNSLFVCLPDSLSVSFTPSLLFFSLLPHVPSYLFL